MMGSVVDSCYYLFNIISLLILTRILICAQLNKIRDNSQSALLKQLSLPLLTHPRSLLGFDCGCHGTQQRGAF